MKLIRSNILLIAFYVIFFIIEVELCLDIGEALDTNKYIFLFVVLIIHGIITVFFMSDYGELSNLAIMGVRKVLTEEEKDYLYPIFKNVYLQAQANNQHINKGIKLYIDDSMIVNAYAVGRQSIVVTLGAIHTFTEEELEGIIAHEFGHIEKYHTLLLHILNANIAMVSLTILVLKIIKPIFGGAIYKIRENMFPFVIVMAQALFTFSISAIVLLSQTIINANSRQNEFEADSYASKIGFKDGLQNALKKTMKISLPSKLSLKERLRASHPHIALRIARLENI